MLFRSVAILGLRELIKDKDSAVRIAAARGLARYIDNRDAVWGLRELIKDSDPKVREAAALALGGK